jgi:GNAT superfamily N-acetyltransferase
MCETPKDKFKLVLEILGLFLPKLVLNRAYMGHAVLGLRSPEKRLVGFVDLSLQPSNGTLDALKPCPLQKRKTLYGEKNLQPYLCNLLVTKDYRKRGLGRKLVSACVEVAKQWGHCTINLHVETTSAAALSLYLKSNFLPVETFRSNNGVIFMRKKFPLT